MPERFTGSTLPAVMERIREVLGEDALILRSTVRRGGGVEAVEIVAAGPGEVEALRARLRVGEAFRRGAGAHADPHGAYRIALVGPPGGGRTTALLKLALAAERHRGSRSGRLGVLLLDGGRRASADHVRDFADLAGVPLEVAETPGEVPLGLESLAACDVVLVDTPPLGAVDRAMGTGWFRTLEAVRPHEIHLVLPAGLRSEVARRARDVLPTLRPTHVLFSQVDLLPPGPELGRLALDVDLPARWLSDGDDPFVPLRPAVERILESMGQRGGALPLPLRQAG